MSILEVLAMNIVVSACVSFVVSHIVTYKGGDMK